MKKYFVNYSDFANAYRVASTDDAATASAMLAEGWERITIKEANDLCNR
ncbi:MAG: hypothetical protein ACI3YH_03220 [Eubacteriales bacterium]